MQPRPTPSAQVAPASALTVVDSGRMSKMINEHGTTSLKEKFSLLIRNGFLGNLEQVIEQLLTRLNEMGANLSESPNSRFVVWKPFAREFPFSFFTECILFPCGDDICALGPKSEKEIILLKIERKKSSRLAPQEQGDEDELLGAGDTELCGQITVQKIIGTVPDSLIMFRKMPLNFIYNGMLYLGYIDTEERFQVLTLSLLTWEMKPLQIGNAAPSVHHTVAFEGCLLDQKMYLVTSPTSMSSLDLSVPNSSWSAHSLKGTPPTSLTGSSNMHGGKILVFGNPGCHLFELDLVSLEWSSRMMFNAPKIGLRDCHLIRPLSSTQLVLIRTSDNSEVWIFDVPSSTWEKRPSAGLRPGDYYTNPSYIILDGAVYCLGGQSTGKHALSSAPSRAPAAVQPEPRLPQLTQLPQRAPASAPAPAPAPAPTPMAMPPIVLNKNRKNFMAKLVLKKPHEITEADVVKKRLSAMWSESFMDVTFTFPAGGEVRAHRAVLASNPKLRKMFEEAPGTSVFHIPHYTRASFADFTSHFYEKLDPSRLSNPVELYLISEEFGEGSLKVKVLDSFDTNDAGSLIELFKLTTQLSGTPCNTRMKRKAEDELVREFTKISTTPHWARFCLSNQELLPKVFRLLGERKSS